MLIQGFARGEICVSHNASSIGDDIFVMLFLKPEADPTVVEPMLSLPNYTSFYNRNETIWGQQKWLGARFGEAVYREAFEKTLRKIRPNGLSIDDVWDGDGNNPNAWTLFLRHEMSAETYTGAQLPHAGMPRSAWLLSYATAERTFYNAAVHFKFWGHLKQKFDTYDWQAYTRTEAEDLFLTLIPDTEYRNFMREQWTGNIGRWVKGLRRDYAEGRPANTKKDYTYESLLLDLLNKMSDKVVNRSVTLNNWPDRTTIHKLKDSPDPIIKWENGLRSVVANGERFARYLPNVSHIRFNNRLYTMFPNRAYSNEKEALVARISRIPHKDTVGIIHGLAGVYSNLFFNVQSHDSDRFISRILSVNSNEEWHAFADNFKVSRTSPKFWEFSDWLHEWMAINMPVEGAILDYRYYDYYD